MKKKSLLKRVAILSVVMALLAMFISGVFLYSLFKHSAIKNMEEKLNSAVDVCCFQIYDYYAYPWLMDYWKEHGDEMEVLPYGGDQERLTAWVNKTAYLFSRETSRITQEEVEAMSPEEQKDFAEFCYTQLYRQLSSFRNSFDIDAMSLFIPAKDGKTAYNIFLISGENAGKSYLEIKRSLGTELPFDPALQPEAQKVMNMETIISEIEFYRSSVDGKEYAVIYDVVGSEGEFKGIFSLTESMELLNREVWENVFSFEIWIALAIAAAVFLLLLTIYLTTLKPAVVLQKEICTYTEDKDRESFTKRLDELMKRGDEIGRISADVNDMACEIQRHYSEIIQLTAEKEHLEGELSMAANLKAHLMPNVFPAFPEEKAFDIMADQITAEGVGGDYYDFFRVDEDHIAFVMADIFAGGSVSALYMIVFKLLLTSISKLGFPAEETMQIINGRMCEANEDDLSLSAWYGIYEISSGKVEAVNAGHENAILIRNDKAELLEDEVQSYLVGIFPEMKYNSFSFYLAPGDRLVLYTDGAYRAKDPKEKQEDPNVLLSVFGDEKNRNVQETIAVLQEKLLSRMDAKTLTEDVTFLCLERKRRQGDEKHE